VTVKRLLAVMAACALLASLGGAPAAARVRATSGPAGMTYKLYQKNIQSPVEQETDYPFPADQSEWVINPFGDVPCGWDVDDYWQKMAMGSLRAGETLAIDECMIASPGSSWRTIYGQTAWWSTSPGWYGVQVRADTDALSVSVCYQPEGRCFTPGLVYDAPNRSWLYNLCLTAVLANDDPLLGEIPGSQGGIGLVQTLTVSVANQTGRTARNVASSIGAVGASQQSLGWGGCMKNAPITLDYPFRYTQ